MAQSPHPLDLWLAQKGKSRPWLADRIKSTEATVSRIINGLQWPSKSLLQRIYKITDGEVTANDFAHDAERAA